MLLVGIFACLWAILAIFTQSFKYQPTHPRGPPLIRSRARSDCVKVGREGQTALRSGARSDCVKVGRGPTALRSGARVRLL